MKKYCGICKKKKLLNLFNSNKNTKDELQTECRECKKKRYINNRTIIPPVKNLINEMWRPMKNYQSKYSVSSFGRIKSMSRIENRKDGRKFNYSEKIIIATKNKKTGYLSFTVSYCGKRLYIHRLVAQNFILNKNNKPCVNHKNGVKTDNRIENLEWVTYSENMSSAYKIGLKIGKRAALWSYQ